MTPTTIEPAVQAAHEALWARFIDQHGVILDYVGLEGELSRPTPEECFLSQPNGMSWGVPNENGSFFGGIYLEAMLNRWRLTGLKEDHAKVRQIAEGLRLLASVGETRGFVARGVADDGHSHFSIGSNDQTTPWLYGMWCYVTSEAPEPTEREVALAKLIEVAEVLYECRWQTPCDRPPFEFRSDLSRFAFEGAPRMLWVCRAMARLTGDRVWEERYRQAVTEPNPKGGPDRLAICREGMVWEYGNMPHSWTSSNSVCMLRGLWEMEDDPERKSAYLEGLRGSAQLAAESLPLALQFDHEDPRPFSCNWRVMNEVWQEEQTIEGTVALAERGLARQRQESPRTPYEAALVREPMFAAWVVSLCPDRAFVEPHTEAIMAALRHFDYRRLYMSQFFAGEAAYYQLLV